MKELKKCLFCDKEFLADTRELKRGNARFCSISCSCKYRNKNNPKKKCKCVVCESEFLSISTKAKYCSSKCKSKHYRELLITDKGLTYTFQRILLNLPCANCGWDLGPRDVHHILHVAEGGKNDLHNLITLCPNCHRLCHRNLLSKDKLIQLVEFRTISSSSKSEELDAVSGN